MSSRRGFTLVELMVVVVIMLTVAYFAMPQLAKTVETSRSQDAVALLNGLGAGVRMFKSDWPSGTFSPTTYLVTDNNTAACPASGKPTTVGELFGCKYITPHSWDDLKYQYYVCESGNPAGTCCSTSAGVIACADRRDNDGTDATSAPYKDWMFWLDSYGGCHAPTSNSNPPCPKI